MKKFNALLLTVACAFLLSTVLAEAAPQGQGEERTLWSNILRAFGPDGTVNLTALISNLNDPNLNKLARSLGQANFTKLERALSSPNIDIEDLMGALREYELLDDTRSMLNAEDGRLMGTLERWAAKLADVRDRVFRPATPPHEVPAKAPAAPVEQSPMVKKNSVQGSGDSKTVEVKGAEKETHGEPADPAGSPEVVREKKEAPHHKTYGGSRFPHITVHSGGGGGDKHAEEDSQTEEEWSLVVVWLIVCVGVAIGLLLGIVLFKLVALLVWKLRGDSSPADAPTPAETDSHFIAV